ncbi:hypothetical protein [Streptomyces sp. NPDC091268]|uniref:hypothetical protein n=1 Tax=Streptomyces sp. NPDC091268 TaxID=3365979 RepID=UPI003806AE0D
MSEREPKRQHPTTPPSRAVGESGDHEARQEADEAVAGRLGEAGAAEEAGHGGGHTEKRQQPGKGREEQTRPAGEGTTGEG